MVCSLCVVRGVVSGSGLMPAEYMKVHLRITPNGGDAKADFEREVVFTANEVIRDDVGGYTATGELRGAFGVFPDREESESAEATMDAFARGGDVQFVKLEVPDGKGGIRFLATFRPTEDPDAFEGTAFMSRVAERRRRRSRLRPIG
jgi:hypothetical protein